MSFWNSDHGETQEEVVANVATSAFTNITDSIIDAHSAIKVLAITVTAELGLFAMFYVSKGKVADFLADSETELWIYASIAVFLIGFLTAFATYRLVASKWRHRNSGIWIWAVSIAAGSANILLYFAFLTLEVR